MAIRIGLSGASGSGKTTVLHELLVRFGATYGGVNYLEIPWLKDKIRVLPSVVREVLKERGVTENDLAIMSKSENWTIQKAIWDARMAAETPILTWDRKQNDPILTLDQPVSDTFSAVPKPEINRSFISDRTLLDHFAYVIYRCGDAIPEADLALLKSQLVENMATYDSVFFFPRFPRSVKIDDGVRQTDEAYLTTIDLLMRGLLQTIFVRTVYPYPVFDSAVLDSLRPRPLHILPVSTLENRMEIVIFSLKSLGFSGF